MCFILTSIKLNKNEDSLYPILRLMAAEQSSNKHGTGVYCFNEKDDNVSYHRTMKSDFRTMANDLQNFDVVNYHFRQSTSGSQDETNVHFWKYGIWLFAHNGTASDYVKGNKCDSHNLFLTLIQKHLLKSNSYIDWTGIKKLINKSNFFGRIIIINSKTKKMYFMGDWHCYLINRNYMVITSAFSKFEDTVNFLGVEFENNENTIEVLETKLDGIFSFEMPYGFTQLDTEFKVWNNWNYNKNNTENSVKNYANSRETIEDKDCIKEIEELTKKYEDESEKICTSDLTEENLAKLDKLEEDYYTELYNIEDKYLEKQKKKQFKLEIKEKRNEKSEKSKIPLLG